MKVALCNGGLGNQTFQYIFSRFIELAGGQNVIWMIRPFSGDKWNITDLN